MIKNRINRSERTIALWLVLIWSVASIFCFPVYVEAGGSSAEKVVKVGYYPDYATIMEPSSQESRGYGYEYLQEIAKYTGWTYQFVKCSWEEGLHMLQEGKLDLLGPMEKTPAREEIYDFPAMQMGVETGVLFANKDSQLSYDDWEALDGIRVGSEPGKYYIEAMERYCQEKGIQVQYVYTDSKDISRELREGRYDAYLTGDLYTVPGTMVVARLSATPYYYATTKGNREILEGMNKALQEIFKRDKYFEEKLYDKYFSGRENSKPGMDKSELEVVKKYPKLVVGCESDSRPLQYYDRDSGLPSGICIDILTEVGRLSGIEFQFVPITSSKGKVAKQKLEEVDLYAGHRGGILAGGRDTAAYLSIPMMLVSDEQINLSDPLKVAVYSFDKMNYNQLKKEYPQFFVQTAETSEEALKVLHSGEADAMLMPAYIYNELEQLEKTSSFFVYSTDLKCRMNLQVSEQLPEKMIDILNKGIARLDGDVVNTIIYKNTSASAYEVSFGRLIKENAWSLLGLVVVLFGAALFLIERNNKKLKSILYVDKSTGKSSLAKFHLEARDLLDSAEPEEYMLVSMDVNNFKYINDIYGYDVGNQVLQALAEHIEQILPGEILLTARRTADNFVFIGKAADKNQIFASIADDRNLRKDVQAILGQDYELNLSIGAYVIHQPEKNLSIMLDYANIAKKTVKGRVGNPIAEYTPEMAENMELKKKVTVGMEAGLLHKEFITCIQPKYSLSDETLIGAEVLVRWKHPELGMLSPMLFIPLFEENGFIEKLDLYIFESTCQMIQKWRQAGADKIPRISVNVSRVTLGRENLVKDMLELAKKYQVQTPGLEIEITEGTLEKNTERIIDIINEFKAAGFYVSIDDFGSGYSSLSILKDMPADIIKIDKEFLSETFDSQKGRNIIRSVIKMSKELNLEIVAEGIQTREQAEALRAMECDVAQGYYFARPMQPQDFEDLILQAAKKN
ncbi:EAL domain-containing protein [Aminipila butyrica]|uniref:EAL domain-containing protein n=1 Tax=Aminipila butyrica TaxID=433296 RepID=A0A858BV31_9FIRM|nr:EAL domain-containing protein [Aminipila butyrica]QIB69049.1 EAL domain-containing protein [Aminipila butyrica]